jgi:RNA polymerase sigma-70 factor, ECF subfamily
MSHSMPLGVILICEEGPRSMAKFGQSSSSRRDALQKALPRLYKFALVLSANEELARALLRATVKALNVRHEWREEDRDRLTGAFRRMHALWSTKMGEDPAIQKKCPPDPRIFAASLAGGPAAGNAQFARFIATLPSSQRAVLYLVYGEGASYDEAAEVTALNMLALMKLLARGHLALTHWLDQRGLADEADGLDLDPYMDREHAV